MTFGAAAMEYARRVATLKRDAWAVGLVTNDLVKPTVGRATTRE